MNELTTLNNDYNKLREKFHDWLTSAYDNEGNIYMTDTLNILVDTMDELLTLLAETTRR